MNLRHKPEIPYPALMLVTENIPSIVQRVDAAIDGGCGLIQLRGFDPAKSVDQRIMEEIGEIAASRAILLINSNFEMAKRLNTNGIHLPEWFKPDPFAWQQAKQTEGWLLGRSAHSLEGAMEAEALGCDYIIAGTIFATQSHPDTQPAGIDFLNKVCQSVGIPVLAIGGITPERAAACMLAGARGVAVLRGLTQANDPTLMAKQYLQAMTNAIAQRNKEQD